MAFRSRSRVVRARAPRKRAIWVSIPFAAVAYTETTGVQLLLTPADWEAQFGGTGMEHAVLRAIVGEIYCFQTVVSTTGGVPTFFGIFKTDIGVTAAPAFTVAGMSTIDWLTTGVVPCTTTVTASTIQAGHGNYVIPIRVKAKRKLTSQDEIRICAQVGSDAGSPAGTINGLLRFLIARD